MGRFLAVLLLWNFSWHQTWELFLEGVAFEERKKGLKGAANNWLVLSDEQMSKGCPFSLLNDEQMSNWLGVEHQPDKSFSHHGLKPFSFSGIWCFPLGYQKIVSGHLRCCKHSAFDIYTPGSTWLAAKNTIVFMVFYQKRLMCCLFDIFFLCLALCCVEH